MQPPATARSVFSLWAWIVLAPYLLTAFGGYDTARTAQEWAVGVSTAIEVQLALGLAFIVLGFIERRLAPWPVARWTFVGAALVAIAIGRPLLAAVLQGVFGIELVPTSPMLRFLMNLVVISIAVLLVNGLIESVARNLEVRRRLLTVLASLRAQADHIEEEQEQIAASFQREVAEPVVDALGRLIPRDLAPDQLAEELEWIAELVVRPISHRARGAGLDEALADIDPTLPPPKPARPLLRPSRIVAVRAWVLTLVTSALFMPVEFTANGVGLGTLLLIAGAAASFLGGLVVQQIPLPRRTDLAIVALSALYLGLGALVVWVLIGPTAASPLAGFYVVYTSAGFATVAMLLAIILSSVRELAANQQRIATAVTHAERRVYRARQALAEAGARITRLLHTTVQGDIIGTALRLKAGDASPEALDDLLERVERRLTVEGVNEDDGDAPALAIQEAIRSTLTTWSRSLDLSSEVSDAALDWLAAHPSAAALANDTITEGLTNAVRHGSAAAARVRIGLVPAPEGDAVEVLVTSPGRLAPRLTSGLGLQDLDARARRLDLAQEGEDVVLSVLV